ncbi:Imm26 family immunity protein [Sphingomonas sp. 7/4-4]|uniref:Imm26 family immunity protein n=1 Tax=Sphingomonas sp. 7/4-4 TaxID=3018446 RepID=UPI0022F405E6|nr:Imm26 family immunity protein [Sphingomonas sp. 7/4-4]WBY08217.1 Imm26 family immunity protein [Sphingomonas sp. 7/4-4]
MLRRVKRKEGQVLKIKLQNGMFSLGISLKEPIISFFDRVYREDDLPQSVNNIPIAFSIMVMNSAITSGRWEVIYSSEIPDQLKSIPKFCKKDQVTGELSIYHEIVELAPHYERPASLEECKELEVAAVWEAEHVEDRLLDHFLGKPNIWVDQLRIR